MDREYTLHEDLRMVKHVISDTNDLIKILKY